MRTQPAPGVLETRFVLPRDVVVAPVGTLSQKVRATVDCDDGDFAVARPRSRRPSSIVDPAMADLLLEFRQPSRLVDAIIRFSGARGLDPEDTLVQAFGAIQNFCNSKLLVTEDDAESAGLAPSLAPGQRFRGFEVLRAVHVLEDTELYQARYRAQRRELLVALKIERVAGSAAGETIRREAAVLRRLDGGCAPALVARGSNRGRAYLATEWRAGSSGATVADELRALADSNGGAALEDLCCRILAAYSSLHERGVVHGDIHPGNILVDEKGTVTIIDFGASVLPSDRSRHAQAMRAAVAYYYDPQTAGSVLAGRVPAPATAASDQYALAVLLDRLLTGAYYLDFRSEQDQLCRQIIESKPQPFSARGMPPRPAMEAVLRRALEKKPQDRFPSVASFRQAFVESCGDAAPQAVKALWMAPRSDRFAAAEAKYGWDSDFFREGFPSTPTASLWAGAAGLAWVFYRGAAIRGDAALLGLADAWATRAVRVHSREAGAFFNPARGITPTRVGAVSPFHTANGVHAVAALVGRARGDLRAFGQEIVDFVDTSAAPCSQLDLAVGQSGAVLAAAVLLQLGSGTEGAQMDRLRGFVRRQAGEIWALVGGCADLADCPHLPHLGMAHGWVGVLFTQLRAAQLSGTALPADLVDKLEQLARFAQPAGRGVVWPGTVAGGSSVGRTPDHAPGWCSGSAGHIHLWTLAHEVLGAGRYLELAERSAWAAWEHDDRSPSLCCGVAGRALALLRLYQRTGEPTWRIKASRLLAEVAGDEDSARVMPDLFNGPLGVALLQVELECPELAVMPLFGG
jgi:eukaryotic-like serine/threonine-protein kinase